MAMRSSDPAAMRRRIRRGPNSQNMYTYQGNQGVNFRVSAARNPLRVAGSLVPSRALGDEYLKHAKYSCHPFTKHLPYITHKPQVRTYHVKRNPNASAESAATPLSIVIATDGLWDLLSNNTAGMLSLGWAVMEGRGMETTSNSQSTTADEEIEENPLLRSSKRRRVSRRSTGATKFGNMAPRLKNAAELLVYSALRVSHIYSHFHFEVFSLLFFFLRSLPSPDYLFSHCSVSNYCVFVFCAAFRAGICVHIDDGSTGAAAASQGKSSTPGHGRCHCRRSCL